MADQQQPQQLQERRGKRRRTKFTVRHYRRLNTLWSSLADETQSAILYIIFLGLFCAAFFGPQDPQAYDFSAAIEGQFFDTTFALDTTYYDIVDNAQMVEWMQVGFLPAFIPPDRNGYADPSSSGSGNVNIVPGAYYTSGTNALRIGLGRIRLVRAKQADCKVSDILPNSTVCFRGVLENEDKEPFLRYEWQSAEKLKQPSIESAATKMVYPGSGYVIDIPDNYADAAELLQWLVNASFVDGSTRLVAVDFALYNANVNMVSVVTALLETSPTGRTMPTVIMRTAPLLLVESVTSGEGDNYAQAIFTTEVFFYGFVIFYILKDLHTMWKEGGPIKYLWTSFWRWIDAVNLMLFVTVMSYRISLSLEIHNVYDDLATRTEYVEEMVGIADKYILATRISAINTVICALRFFPVVRVHKGLAQFTDTLAFAATDMAVLASIIVVVLSGYGSAFQLSFGGTVESYRDLSQACLTLFRAMLGDMYLDDVRDSNRYLGPVLFVSYLVIMVFVVLSMFLTTITNSFESAHDAAMEALVEEQEEVEMQKEAAAVAATAAAKNLDDKDDKMGEKDHGNGISSNSSGGGGGGGGGASDSGSGGARRAKSSTINQDMVRLRTYGQLKADQYVTWTSRLWNNRKRGRIYLDEEGDGGDDGGGGGDGGGGSGGGSGGGGGGDGQVSGKANSQKVGGGDGGGRQNFSAHVLGHTANEAITDFIFGMNKDKDNEWLKEQETVSEKSLLQRIERLRKQQYELQQIVDKITARLA